MKRRELARFLGYGLLASGLPGLTLAAGAGKNKLVLVILRGALDGLALVAPYGDRDYRKLRGSLAIEKPGRENGLLELDGFFGLHPSMQQTHQLFQQRQALMVHAVASPYRERSHFDGQDALESGLEGVGSSRNGWLNRALAEVNRQQQTATALALSQTTPLVLQGSQQISSWVPSRLPDAGESTINRIQQMYTADEFFSTRLEAALESQAIAGSMSGMGEAARQSEREQSRTLMQSAGRFLSAPGGPDIAVVEIGGWDTHANQGGASGALANRLSWLDGDLSALRKELDEQWSRTAVLVVTEFGRTARVNGSRGTDHGTAAAAMLLGGAVQGGKVVTQWPGLSGASLYQNRDLQPTMDLRALFKSTLRHQFSLTETALSETVFPGSQSVKPVKDLLA